MSLPLIVQNSPLTAHNTFHLPARAKHMAIISEVDMIQALVSDDYWQAVPRYILGGGSNILFTGDFDGLLIKNELKGHLVLKETDDYVLFKIMSGENWHNTVLYAIEQGWGGIENLSLIPGTVGAAPMQNIGAYGAEIQDTFHLLEAVNLQTGQLETFDKSACAFGYRESVFKKEARRKYFISSVILKLRKHPELNLSYGAIRQTLAEMEIDQPTIRSVSDAVIKIRQSKLPDPVEIGNAGSFFKNPVIARSQFEDVQKQYPEIPYYQIEDDIKIPAGWLIEQCGWKGKKVGNTGAHKNQALVLVNYGEATGMEIWELAKAIQQSVMERFGIQLQPEVNVL